jgi:predicted lipoprotein with Yx(FWY)xxD motif
VDYVTVHTHSKESIMRRRSASLATIGLALALAACGSSSPSSSASKPPAPGTASTVSVGTVGGVANVLVDANGKPLYSPDEEADGMVRCTGACTSFWMPLAPGAAAPTTAPAGLTLGVISRPDGSQQVTASGKPLYTFAEDSPGQLNGNGFADDFNGQHFTWHVIEASGSPSTATPPASRAGGNAGYGY